MKNGNWDVFGGHGGRCGHGGLIFPFCLPYNEVGQVQAESRACHWGKWLAANLWVSMSPALIVQPPIDIFVLFLYSFGPQSIFPWLTGRAASLATLMKSANKTKTSSRQIAFHSRISRPCCVLQSWKSAYLRLFPVLYMLSTVRIFTCIFACINYETHELRGWWFLSW